MEQASSAVTVPASKGDTEVHLLTDLPGKDFVTIGDSQYGIVGRGKPAGEFTTVFIPVSTGPWMDVPAGSTSIPLTSVAGFAAGDKMGIGLGGDYEVVTVTGVGTPATQSVLSQAAKAGDTRLSIEVTASLLPGSVVTVNTGDRVETVRVKTLVRASDPPAPRRFGQPAQPREPGIIELEEPLKKDHSAGVDISCPGSGVSFTPATRFAHISGEAVQPLGTPYILGSPLKEDVSVYDAADPFVCTGGTSFDYDSFGYAPSPSAGSVALIDPASGTVLDAVVYGSEQSNSSANGTIASPEFATLEGVQAGGGCIAVLPPQRPAFGPWAAAPQPARSLIRYPDGKDTDMLCRDFTLTDNATPGLLNLPSGDRP